MYMYTRKAGKQGALRSEGRFSFSYHVAYSLSNERVALKFLVNDIVLLSL